MRQEKKEKEDWSEFKITKMRQIKTWRIYKLERRERDNIFHEQQ